MICRKVGFTGTQLGASPEQLACVKLLLATLQARKVHHGLCIGADVQFHHIARECGLWIVGHPCNLEHKQATNLQCDELRPIKRPIVRNHDIVDSTQCLIATPRQDFEVLRSGTWATVRYAHSIGRRVYLIARDGRML